jgi:hypothetical protein
MRRTACLLGVVAVLLGAGDGVARADVYDDNPATASRTALETYVFVRATDAAIYAKHRVTGGWSPWESLGGNTTSGPAAVAFDGTIHVFARGVDGAVWQTWLQGDGTWHSWISLGGYTLSAPSATVRRGEGYLDLVVRGGDSQMYHQAYLPGTGWSGFAPIGGVLTSAASVNSQSPHLLNIWSRAIDGTLVQKSWTGSAWTDWSNLGGGIIGAPTSISRQESVIDVYVRAGGDTTYQRGWTAAGGWTAWLLLDPTPIASAPAAGADSADREYLFARRGSDSLQYKEWNAGTGWSAWIDLGQIALPPPPPPAPAPSAPTPIDGQVNLRTGLRCTPAGGRLRVSVSIKKPKGKKKPLVTKIVFFTRGKGSKVRVDRKAPFEVRIPINRPAGSTGRVYARVYYKRSARGKISRKVVSRRYRVCR